MTYNFRLIASCPDRVGIVSTVSDFIAQRNYLIVEANQYTDPSSRRFFMRYVIEGKDHEEFSRDFCTLGEKFDMDWRIADTRHTPKVLIMASRQEHCLMDLLHRWKSEDMKFEVPCVINNHEEHRDYVEWHGIPYHCIAVAKDHSEKEQAFNKIDALIEKYQPDVIVLARYMQVLPSWFCEKYQGKIINIHHSFLPSFAGAKPYHQAKSRGVKLTGATCHYVTAVLDDGPIIEQDVIRISHHNSVEDIIRLGKDVERNVLARGLRYHLEDRVLIDENKTIVFS